MSADACSMSYGDACKLLRAAREAAKTPKEAHDIMVDVLSSVDKRSNLWRAAECLRQVSLLQKHGYGFYKEVWIPPEGCPPESMEFAGRGGNIDSVEGGWDDELTVEINLYTFKYDGDLNIAAKWCFSDAFVTLPLAKVAVMEEKDRPEWARLADMPGTTDEERARGLALVDGKAVTCCSPMFSLAMDAARELGADDADEDEEGRAKKRRRFVAAALAASGTAIVDPTDAKPVDGKLVQEI